MSTSSAWKWRPIDADKIAHFSYGNYAIAVLNTPIRIPPPVLTRLWNGASIRSTIDGGTDRWLEFVKTEAIDASPKFPDIVSGDFDSIQQSTLALCKENGSEVVPTPDQDFTDFEKGLRALTARCNLRLDSIVVIAELGGRIDQTISCLNTLRIGVELPGSPRIYLLSRSCMTWWLSRGSHEITIPRYLKERQEWCAILPFEPKADNSVTTTGLKWDLDGGTIKFGGLISSSNTYDKDDKSNLVKLRTDAELIWSMGLVWE
ncbi:thiamin pyrophosphokinase [Nesidiocoris tenuis]|uniref:Thiamin pyrophosphokinase n=1 Tax=Nesidiocoris tenuis TaxID=355587 RepID=A0ABN7AG05_9HEMI|nr:thiamin pyrophosphokinase [Nesidiocoris tenuis]